MDSNSARRGRALPHERHRVPQHEVHPFCVHRVDKTAHVRDAQRTPVAGIRITPPRVHCLPAVVDNDRAVPEFLCNVELGQDGGDFELLMEVIPCRVDRHKRGSRHCHGSVTRLLCPPGGNVVEGTREGDVTQIEPYLRCVVHCRRQRLGEETHFEFKVNIFLANVRG